MTRCVRCGDPIEDATLFGATHCEGCRTAILRSTARDVVIDEDVLDAEDVATEVRVAVDVEVAVEVLDPVDPEAHGRRTRRRARRRRQDDEDAAGEVVAGP